MNWRPVLALALVVGMTACGDWSPSTPQNRARSASDLPIPRTAHVDTVGDDDGGLQGPVTYLVQLTLDSSSFALVVEEAKRRGYQGFRDSASGPSVTRGMARGSWGWYSVVVSENHKKITEVYLDAKRRKVTVYTSND